MPITLDGGAGVTYPDGIQQTNAVTNTGGTPRYYAARAWVVFDGTVSPPTILSSAGVSSIAKNGTGDYTITFSSAMPTSNYAVIISAGAGDGSGVTGVVDSATPPTTSALRVQLSYFFYPASTASSSSIDSARVSVVVFA